MAEADAKFSRLAAMGKHHAMANIDGPVCLQPYATEADAAPTSEG